MDCKVNIIYCKENIYIHKFNKFSFRIYGRNPRKKFENPVKWIMKGIKETNLRSLPNRTYIIIQSNSTKIETINVTAEFIQTLMYLYHYGI